jgi:hypothetical protein
VEEKQVAGGAGPAGEGCAEDGMQQAEPEQLRASSDGQPVSGEPQAEAPEAAGCTRASPGPAQNLGSAQPATGGEPAPAEVHAQQAAEEAAADQPYAQPQEPAGTSDVAQPVDVDGAGAAPPAAGGEGQMVETAGGAALVDSLGRAADAALEPPEPKAAQHAEDQVTCWTPHQLCLGHLLTGRLFMLNMPTACCRRCPCQRVTQPSCL